MRLKRRSKPPRPDPKDVAPFVAGMYMALEENLERCGRLTQLRAEGAPADAFRPEAVKGAREIALVSRMTGEAILLGVIPPDAVSQDFMSFKAFGALGRLGYALQALTEEEPEPEQLMSQAELDGLFAQYGIEAWYDKLRAAADRVRAAEG
jgi:hypothetical protein